MSDAEFPELSLSATTPEGKEGGRQRSWTGLRGRFGAIRGCPAGQQGTGTTMSKEESPQAKPTGDCARGEGASVGRKGNGQQRSWARLREGLGTTRGCPKGRPWTGTPMSKYKSPKPNLSATAPEGKERWLEGREAGGKGGGQAYARDLEQHAGVPRGGCGPARG